MVKLRKIALSVALICLNYEMALESAHAADAVTDVEKMHESEQSAVKLMPSPPEVPRTEPAAADMLTLQPPNPEMGSMQVEGDRLEVRIDRSFKSIGHAELHHENQDVYGDSIEYDMQNDTLHVKGNTRFEKDGDVVTGPELRLRLSDTIGEMQEPVFTLKTGANKATDDSARPEAVYTENMLANTIEEKHTDTTSMTAPGSSRGTANIMLFEGATRKTLKDVSYTTCAPGVDDWYLKAGELELDDYTKVATARNARIVFKGCQSCTRRG